MNHSRVHFQKKDFSRAQQQQQRQRKRQRHFQKPQQIDGCNDDTDRALPARFIQTLAGADETELRRRRRTRFPACTVLSVLASAFLLAFLCLSAIILSIFYHYQRQLIARVERGFSMDGLSDAAAVSAAATGTVP